MRITIITVCHNSRKKIEAYVQSFLEQHTNEDDRSRYQFVFVENSGDSDFQTAVRPLVDNGFEVLVINTENEGFGIGCNTGAVHASGDLLIFANPDIRFLCNLGDLLNISPPLAWGTIRQVSEDGRACSIDFFPEHKGLLFELLQINRLINRFPRYFLKYCYVVGSFLIVSKNLFKFSGGFNPAFFLYHEEAELARRLHDMGGPPHINETISIVHESFGSHSSHYEVLKHEAQGFLTYCHVTRQPALIRKQLKTLRVLALLSCASKMRYEILRDATLR